MKCAGIVGIGFWAPSIVRRNDAWPEEFVRTFHEHREARRKADFTEILRRVENRPYEELFAKYAFPFEDDPFKGTFERRVVEPGQSIAQGDATAGRHALEDAGVDPEDIDIVMASAILNDKLFPTNAPAIQDLLGCKKAAPLSVEAYCASAVAQIDLAAALIQAGRARYVLCVTSHQVSPINDLRTPSSPMFGDAAGAFVVGSVPEGRGLFAANRGGDGSLRDAITLTQWTPTKRPWWHGLPEPVIHGSDDLARGRILARDLLRFPIEALRALLRDASVPADAIDVLGVIQPLGWFPKAVAEGVGIKPEAVPDTHAEYAHVGGAAIAANLLRAREQGKLRDGALVALYGHGAGFTRSAALLRWSAKR